MCCGLIFFLDLPAADQLCWPEWCQNCRQPCRQALCRQAAAEGAQINEIYSSLTSFEGVREASWALVTAWLRICVTNEKLYIISVSTEWIWSEIFLESQTKWLYPVLVSWCSSWNGARSTATPILILYLCCCLYDFHRKSYGLAFLALWLDRVC